ncbi:MAG: hypothetical protein D4R39_04370 [Methylophilaceae bacterium]|nr:MAG: hypothetical protein D4R39_04370 [Methylophilaceae bacterium]
MRCKKSLITALLGLFIVLSGCSNLSTRQNNAAAGAAVGGHYQTELYLIQKKAGYLDLGYQYLR